MFLFLMGDVSASADGFSACAAERFLKAVSATRLMERLNQTSIVGHPGPRCRGSECRFQKRCFPAKPAPKKIVRCLRARHAKIWLTRNS